MFLRSLRYFCILFYLMGSIISLCMGLYFIQYIDCSLEGDLVVWLIISSLTNLIFITTIHIVKKYYPRFNFLRLRRDKLSLDNEINLEQNLIFTDSSDSSEKYEKRVVILICILYFFFIIWTLFGLILAQKTSCEILSLYDIVLFQVFSNLVYVLFTFVIILVRLVEIIFA